MHVPNQQYKCLYSRPVWQNLPSSYILSLLSVWGDKNPEKKKINKMFFPEQNINLRTFSLSFGLLPTPLISFISWVELPNQSYFGQSSTDLCEVLSGSTWRAHYALGLINQMCTYTLSTRLPVYMYPHVEWLVGYNFFFHSWYSSAIDVSFVTQMSPTRCKRGIPTAELSNCVSHCLTAPSRSPALLWVKAADGTYMLQCVLHR